MGLFKRVGDVAKRRKAESTEGLIINIGVINALILAFALPLMVSVDMEVFDRLDFQFILSSNMEFRQFAIYVMDHTDIGTYKEQHFNWTVITGVDKTVDVKAILLQSPTSRTGQHRIWNVKDDVASKLMFAIEALQGHFPMWQMRTWRAQHPELNLAGGSDACYLHMGISTALLLLGILNSMSYYVSFTISPTHEDENSKGLIQWNRFGIPLVLSLYALHVLAVLLFVWGLSSLVYAHAPTLSQQIFLREVGFYGIVIPIFLLFGVGASFLLTWKSFKAFYAAQDDSE